MERVRDQLYWLIRLLGTLEMCLHEMDATAFEDGEEAWFEPDWRMICNRLMPEIYLQLGETTIGKKRRQWPAAVIVPSMGEYFRVISDEDLDVLKSYLDNIVPENETLASLRILASRSNRITERNAKHKWLRLVGELTKMVEADV